MVGNQGKESVEILLLGLTKQCGVLGLRGLVKPTTMVMLCPTGVNPIGPNWGENALVTKYSGTLELQNTLTKYVPVHNR